MSGRFTDDTSLIPSEELNMDQEGAEETEVVDNWKRQQHATRTKCRCQCQLHG
jgi:hypothetical protein